MTLLAVLACLVGSVLAALRWLRVAQREHYLAGQTTRFAIRWWAGLGYNRLLAVTVVLGVVLAFFDPFFALLTAAAVAAGPFGLRLRGRAPGPLAWTRRLRTLAAVTAGLWLAIVGVGWLLGAAGAFAAVATAAFPLVVDAALAITGPLEQRAGSQWTGKAEKRLRDLAPLVIGITGSYGKTTTKGYVAHLVEGSRTVLATPRSFNNSAGLARAVNEHLVPGTEVFVAEMGTYGPGEIGAMCEWVRPSVSAITAIGPVHLERMGSEETIVRAKREIFSTADVAVLNVDNEWLAPLVAELEAEGKRVVRCSATDRQADVHAHRDGSELVVSVGGKEVARAGGTAAEVPPTNVAVAVALALEAGVPRERLAERLPALPVAPNRLTVTTGAGGATILDDTYNANPAGARAALELLRRHAEGANHVAVVTPGMVELGDRQHDENRRFAAAASEIATEVVVVGNTNRAALVEGAHQGRARVVVVDVREEAVGWVRENLGPGDVVLYENDLPDHFP